MGQLENDVLNKRFLREKKIRIDKQKKYQKEGNIHSYEDFEKPFEVPGSGIEDPLDWDNRFTWQITLPPIPESFDESSQEYQDILAVHRAFSLNKARDKAIMHGLYSSESETRIAAGVLNNEIRETAIDLIGEIELQKSAWRQEKYHRKMFSRITANWDEADLQTGGNLSMDARVLRRLEKTKGNLRLGFDADLTLTLTERYLHELPGAVHVENYMGVAQHGRQTFPLVFARYVRNLLQQGDMRNVFYRVGEKIGLREGVDEFFELTRKKEMPSVVYSANYAPFVQGIADRLPENTFSKIYSVDYDTILAIEKGLLVQRDVFAYLDDAFVYVADGLTDLAVLEKGSRNLPCFYLAVRNSIFAKELEKTKMPYYTFDNFFEIIEIFKRLRIFT